jgi:hypothetical protein
MRQEGYEAPLASPRQEHVAAGAWLTLILSDRRVHLTIEVVKRVLYSTFLAFVPSRTYRRWRGYYYTLVGFYWSTVLQLMYQQRVCVTDKTLVECNGSQYTTR